MRIPSQFNEDSLYRSGGRSAQSAQSSRRLLRLVLGLALVLVLMRQASRPEIYQVFFGVPAAQRVVLPNDETVRWGETVGWAEAAAWMDGEEGSPASPPVVVDAADRTIANTLIGELAPSDQRRWIVALTRWQRGAEVPEFPSTAESLRDAIATMEIPQGRRDAWLSMLQALADRVAAQGSGPADQAFTQPDETHSVLVQGLIDALDDAADTRVVDGTVWRSGDFDAFYRYLDQAPEFTPRGLAATGVLPLLQQPDVFRGQLVRVHGTVARAEKVDASENVYGMDAYWQLWLRPADGADRPLMVVVPEVTESIAAVGEGSADELGPSVVVAGRFLKRLAYTSSLGADLAPVVVGRLAVLEAAAETAAETDAADAGDSPGPTLGITVLVACLIGFGIAVIAMWRTTAAARDARQLRTAHRQGPDFAGLESRDAGTDDGGAFPTSRDSS